MKLPESFTHIKPTPFASSVTAISPNLVKGTDACGSTLFAFWGFPDYAYMLLGPLFSSLSLSYRQLSSPCLTAVSPCGVAHTHT